MKISAWTTIPGTPRSSFAHVLNENKLYVVGGHPGTFHEYSPSNFSNECHAFDIVSETWQPIASLPIPMQGLRMVASKNFLYAFGGFAPDARLGSNPWAASSRDTTFRYSILQDKWERIDDMPRRRSSHVCARLGDLVYFLGGWDATPQEFGDRLGRFVKSIDVFDLSTQSFLQSGLELEGVPLRRALTCTVSNGRIVLAGGLGSKGYMAADIFADVLTYVPPATPNAVANPTPGCESCRKVARPYVQGELGLLPYLPAPLFSPGIAAWGDDLLIAGGVLPNLAPLNGRTCDSLLVLHAGAEAWAPLTDASGKRLSMSEGRSFVELQSLPDGRIAVIGGHRGYELGSQPSTLVELVER